MSSNIGALHVPAREIPVPSHLSVEARAQFAQGAMSLPPWPQQDDVPAWRRLIETKDREGLGGLSMLSRHMQAQIEERSANGARVFVARLARRSRWRP